jgi:hypothetical protein
MEETMRTKIDVLKQKVLNRAEIARRWFKFKIRDPAAAVAFVSADPDIRRSMDDPQIMSLIREAAIHRVLDAEEAGRGARGRRKVASPARH